MTRTRLIVSALVARLVLLTYGVESRAADPESINGSELPVLVTETPGMVRLQVLLPEDVPPGSVEVRLAGRYNKGTTEFPAGTVLLRAAQPLGALAFYLLEPESDDGLAVWNFLDPYLEAGKTYPVYRTMQEVKASSRLLAPGGH